MVVGNEVVADRSNPKEDPEEEEELVDPMDTLREECKNNVPECTKMHERLATCNQRVKSKEKTEEVCTEELFDFVHCVDKCVSGKLFSILK